jgi:hypothetical protein
MFFSALDRSQGSRGLVSTIEKIPEKENGKKGVDSCRPGLPDDLFKNKTKIPIWGKFSGLYIEKC